MITLLHGDNQLASRNKRSELVNNARAHHFELLFLDGKSIELSDMVLALETISFFSDHKLVVIDQLLTSLKPGKKRDTILNYLIKGSFSTDLILWEDKGVAKNTIKLRKSTHITAIEFTLPKTIFSFVESLYPSNTTQALSLLQESVRAMVPEVIFIMIVRQFRIMIALIHSAQISELVRIAPWQKTKMFVQAERFNKNDLILIYKQLLNIDYQIKTGKSPLNLTKRIEGFIINTLTV